MDDFNRIEDQLAERPHLFVLGAGATKATIPHGDRNGCKTPVMDGFLGTIGKSSILNGISLHTKSQNIEAIYSELYERPECINTVREIEHVISDYFRKLKLPDSPTLYDYLILSLRKKDCIASFNWDPLLVEAYNRVLEITDNLPELLFLHGNVAAGICYECKRYAPLQNTSCPSCGNKLKMTKLLYPVKQKDYSSDLFIRDQWNEFKKYLSCSTILTIWGYSAPTSDEDAKQTMFKAFSSTLRIFDQVEIIDIANENELYNKWHPFIQNAHDHVKFMKSLEESLVWEFPRRSTEGYAKRNFGCWWGTSSVKLKKCSNFEGLSLLLRPLIEEEQEGNATVL